MVFYRPIIFAVVKIVAPKAGGEAAPAASTSTSAARSSPSLRVENLRVTPTAPGPIEKANVGQLELHYSLLTLIAARAELGISSRA